ncbi:MAG: hypothetical protein ACKO23_19970, partial [Gemmataceae bacterium]
MISPHGLLRIVVPTLLITVFSGFAHGQLILEYSFKNAGKNEYPSGKAATFTAAGLSAGNLTRGPDLGSPSVSDISVNNVMASDSWNSEVGDYLEFSISPNAGVNFSISQMDIGNRRAPNPNFFPGANGPVNMSLRSSLDNYGSDLANFTSNSSMGLTTITGFIYSLSNLSSTVTFRIFGSGAGGATGQWLVGYVDDPSPGFQVFGNVS